MVNRGEVWWADLPSEGRRPVLVLTRQAAIPFLTRLVCAPLTRTVRGLRSELELDEDDGLPVACVASFDNLRTVPKTLMRERICTLGPERMAAICPALAAALEC